MKKTALFLSLLLSLAACGKKNDSPDSRAGADASSVPETPPVAGDLVLTAELMEIPGDFPANDLYNYAYVMKYKVAKVLQGSYGDTEILVGHYNPRLARGEIKDEQDAKVGGDLKSFQVGDMHYLVLSPLEGLWTGAVEDDYFKEKRTRYWGLWADKTK